MLLGTDTLNDLDDSGIYADVQPHI